MQTSHRSYRRIILSVLLSLVGICMLVAGLALLALNETRQYVQAASQLQSSQATVHAERATKIVTIFDTVTLRRIPDLQVWLVALSLHEELPVLEQLATTLSQTIAPTDSPFSLSQLQAPLARLESKLTALTAGLDNALIADSLLLPSQRQLLSIATRAVQDSQPVIEHLSQGKQTWIVLFQNSDELRATGGFPGSYALVTLSDGVLSELIVEDIYDADGQFTGYVEAPAGVREYTSSDKGMRLPDANWYSDFPTSAETMLQFFALGNKRNIAGMVAINTAVGATVLKHTGPVALPDYNTTLTADNLTTVLRESRETFFPGSIQKKHILNQAVSVVRQQIITAPPTVQLALITDLIAHIATKDMQAYAVQPELQALITTYGAAGALGVHPLITNLSSTTCSPPSCTPTLFQLVESNVGINKANKYIERTVELRETAAGITARITFRNTAQKSTTTLLSPVLGETWNPKELLATNGYANYQRLLVSAPYTLTDVKIDGRPEDAVARDIQNYELVAEVREFGFLVIVLPDSTTTVELTLQPDVTFSLQSKPLLLAKQSGLPPTLYQLYPLSGPISFTLERDTLVTWQ